MRLSAFIPANMESILREWEAFARSLGTVTAGMETAGLRDHAELMLLAVAADMETQQSDDQQRAKGIGLAPAPAPALPEALAISHGADRAHGGFSLEQMVSEYRALRSSVLRLWAIDQSASGLTWPVADAYEQQMRFSEAIDESLSNSMGTYAAAVDSMLEARTRRRMESLGTLAAGLGHDMGNVLFPMRVCMDALAARGPDPETAALLEALNRAIGHLSGLTKGLRALAVDPDNTRDSAECTVLCEWWALAISPFTWTIPRGVKLHVRGLAVADPPLPPVRVPAHVLMQAVFNIVQNAAQAHADRAQTEAGRAAAASATAGNIWIEADPVSSLNDAEPSSPATPAAPVVPPALLAPAAVRLCVRDDGPGMDENTLRQCTD
ncbi:MAG: hypothetical protein K2X91_14055, partial [Thermoleophilia bacterium]|nr:hypothetical protein [Thermoleophilia bacterium]